MPIFDDQASTGAQTQDGSPWEMMSSEAML